MTFAIPVWEVVAMVVCLAVLVITLLTIFLGK